ncbi:S-layer homology domain-containing protein [Paenibacillus sp. Y412MC10]|uniref:S-layer homology domain-containing protein n=1 Tax=Geobacillus sp. (strain Y412MC10) TaxID=481743 RepID=UPI0016431C11|nr:S-layer homology domain-containing protein [Paenibacillus sp. Y412MC10]
MKRTSKLQRGVSAVMLGSMLISAAAPVSYADGLNGQTAPVVTAEPVNDPTAPAADNSTNTETPQEGQQAQNALQIAHQAPAEVSVDQDFTVSAVITGTAAAGWSGVVKYAVDGNTEASLPLVKVEGKQDTYNAIIPAEALKGTILNYSITLLDEQSKVLQTIAYSVPTKGGETEPGTGQDTVANVSAAGLPLLITEMVPDTANVAGVSADAYEYVEVYNNTDQNINFKDYSFFYNNKDNWTPVSDGDMIIPAHSPAVFWIMNDSNKAETQEAFNKNYGTSLAEGQNLFRINGGGGMANGSARTLSIKDSAGSIIVTASYEAQHVKMNQGILFQHPAEGSVQMAVMPASGQALATPGTVDSAQLVPVEVPKGSETVITHTPPTSVEVQDLEIQAHVENPGKNSDGTPAPVQLLYKTPGQARYTVIPMADAQGTGDYKATIPAAALVESQIDYRIAANQTEKAYSAKVNLPEFDPAKAPPLLVTELVPNTTNVSGTSTDAYEAIEVYNNTDQPVSFKNYKLYYRYPDKGAAGDVVWPSTKEDFVIPSKGTVVFWIKNSANQSYTAEQFNDFYKTNLVENQNLFMIQSDGMSNSGRRAIVIKTNTGKEISASYYDVDTLYENGTKGDETKENMGLHYAYPQNGSTTMIKASTGTQAASPGSVAASQVPSEPVHQEEDNNPPTIEDVTKVKEIEQSKSLELIADAQDDKEVRSVQVYVRSDKQSDYTLHNLSEDFNDTMYHYKLSSAELIGRKYIEYYFAASDGVNETKTDPVKVDVTGGPDSSPLRLNVKDQQIIKGTSTIKGTAESLGSNKLQLSIDGKPVADGNTFTQLEHDAYFVFDAVNVDYYFKNAVTMGPAELGDKSILYTFLDPITTYTTLSFPISADRLKADEDNIIYVRAGSKTGPFDDRPEENKDDFEIKNVRLVLADGTEIWDPAYGVKDQVIKMGDSAGKNESVGFKFNLTADQLKSKAYAWNTLEAADGPHEIKVSDGTDEYKAAVIVDNTPPEIKPSIENGKGYRGEFTLDAEIEDAYAGVDKVDVKLDDQSIKLPYPTSSGSLKGGEHSLTIHAVDKAGNETTRTVKFIVPDENPLAPELVSPQQGQTNVGSSANLTVKVQDPSQDPMNVLFYKGYKYDGSRTEDFTGYLNASVTEPPKEMAPTGETQMNPGDYAKISAEDGKYLVNESVDKFPYQRFEVKLDPSVKSSDRVNIHWKGKSLEGRKVSLYAWSPAQSQWIQLDHVIAGTEDFELNATVKAGDYASGRAIDVMVQDEIAAAAEGAAAGTKPSPEQEDPYDFSFVWMSDTQYYSQSYPKIYQDIVNWIAAQKEKMNIQYVIHTGDVVDKSYEEYQWVEADKDMKVLENAGIPYGVLAGNHDVGHQDNDYTKFKEYFGEDRFKNNSTFAGSYDNNRGHYDLVSSNGNDFIIVYMGWGLGDDEIEWMNEVVSKYPERKAILCLHEYMLVSNNRAPIADQIFEKVVKPNKNVIAALSGHYHDAELKVDELDDNGDGVPDRNVYQMLADYQGAPEGGLGYIRLMQFDMKNNKLHIKTYSPYLNDYNYYDPQENPGKDEFDLDLDLQPKTKRVATDYISVKVYTDSEIGSSRDVASGSQASVSWSGLPADSYQQWYVKAEDAHSGSTLSDIWGFYTGKNNSGNPGGGNGGNNGGNNGGGSGGNGGGNGGGTTPSQPGNGNATSPETPSNPGTGGNKGTVVLKPGTNGSYQVDAKALDQAMTESTNGKIVVTLDGASGQGQLAASLSLPAASVAKAKQNGLSLIVAGPDMTVTVPAASWPGSLTDVQQLVLRMDATMNSTASQAVRDAIGSRSDYSLAGPVYTLKLVKVNDQAEAEIQNLSGTVTVEGKLTPEQLQKLDSDYAGVYELGSGQPKYLGGHFSGGMVSFTADHLAPFAVLEYHKQFADVNGYWADEYIGKLAAKHLVNGIDENRFGPKLNVSRAEFLTMAMRMMGTTSQASGSSAFKDVAADSYYAGAVAEAAKLGLIQGSGGKFRPQDPISREEAASIVVKLAKAMNWSGESAASSSFADMQNVSGWAKQAVTEAGQFGLMNGEGGGKFDPQGQVTRAETAKMMYTLIAQK